MIKKGGDDKYIIKKISCDSTQIWYGGWNCQLVSPPAIWAKLETKKFCTSSQLFVMAFKTWHEHPPFVNISWTLLQTNWWHMITLTNSFLYYNLISSISYFSKHTVEYCFWLQICCKLFRIVLNISMSAGWASNAMCAGCVIASTLKRWLEAFSLCLTPLRSICWQVGVFLW